MEKVKPLNDRVIIKPLPVEDKTSTGIIIPETAKKKSEKGIVFAVGPGKKNYKMTVKKGDKVLYGKYSGTDLKINKKKYIIMHESDIYAIIN
ncbi:MAG: co-chaperone GroES [Candidatus Shikimatogenerans bostrichidophilus]|nr:MAG: co-chaperone GroES [Candidatus Shikimatogenerans bostrichidophilus]